MDEIDLLHRSAAAEEDAADQLGYETPRSGIATPQPDLKDRRLPSINTYFTQVGQDSSCSSTCSHSPALCGASLDPNAPVHALAQYLSPSPEPCLEFPSESGFEEQQAGLALGVPPGHGPEAGPRHKPDHDDRHEHGTKQAVKQDSTDRPESTLDLPVLSRQGSDQSWVHVSSPSSPRTTACCMSTPRGDSEACIPLSSAVVIKGALQPPTQPSCSTSQAPGANSTMVLLLRPHSSSAIHASRPILDGIGQGPGDPSSRGRPRLHRSSLTDYVRLSSRSITIPAPLSQVTSSSFAVAFRHREPFTHTPFYGVPAAHSSHEHSPDSGAAVVQLFQTEPSRAWFSLDSIKKLTIGVISKSGTSTPTRALSAAQPSQTENRLSLIRNCNSSAAPSRSQTPRPSPHGAQAPAPKGKLTIKIAEARGLRKSLTPYVVVVFQRSELISQGPHTSSDNETSGSLTTPVLGGITIQRQGSDTGRSMAIPMRSRQSSNTSIHDHTAFRNRSNRSSFTNPKWDAEAIFDVVDSDMRVDVSVYEQGTQGESFLGHVDFISERNKDRPIRGWFPLKGHADTQADRVPTGEIYVEASYQRGDRKHFGPDDFRILRLIGKGTFGQVYQVRKQDTERIYAMKVLSKKVIVQKKEVAHTVGERNILVRTATSDSPFIVGLKFSFQTPSDLYLVTDYMSGGELFWHLQKEGRFDEQRAKFYIAELILAIQHLHNNDIVYRDLKPENILLDANGHIALCDFGLSKANLTKNDTTNTFCGTTEYLAPEVLLDEAGYTKMVDFWSLGVLVFEMCCGWSPFYAEDIQQMYKNIAFGKVRFPRDTLSTEGRSFVKGLLNRNPQHRLGAIDDAEELKRHNFFADIDWNLLAKKLITPPFRPKLSSVTDVSYFDPEFTTALDRNGSLNERAAALAGGFATSTPLSPSVQANFQGFTFVDERALDEHMRDRAAMMRDQHMDDGDRDGGDRDDGDRDDEDNAAVGDDDWDDAETYSGQWEANRMSGVVGSHTNDIMFDE